MDKVSFLYNFLSKYKYYLVIVIGVVFVGFVGENSIYRSIVLHFEIVDLKTEVDKYTKIYEMDKNQLRDLERNPKNIERIARERYFMKTDDEDIFVLSTDPSNINELTNEATDETVD